MKKIVFLDEYSLGGNDLSSIKSLGDYTAYDRTTPEQVLERCKGATVIITNKVYISRETMQQLPELKLIAISATGMNNVDLEAAAELGIEYFVIDAGWFGTKPNWDHCIGEWSENIVDFLPDDAIRVSISRVSNASEESLANTRVIEINADVAFDL